MQGDLFIEEFDGNNNTPVDLSDIDMYFGDSNFSRVLLNRSGSFLKTLPKGKYMMFPTGSIHRVPTYGDRNDFPYVVNMWTGKVISVRYGGKLYPLLDIRLTGKIKQTFQMHRLAAMAFLPNPLPQDRIMVHHINQDKYDYALSNLEWVTPSYNNQDSWENRTLGMKAMETVTYV